MDQVPSNEPVETADDGQRHGVIDEELDQHHYFGIGGSQLFGERVTDFEQRDVVHAKLAQVREPGGRHCANNGHRPYGRSHGHCEPGGEPAANGRVQLAHRVHYGKVPVCAQRRQREHRYADGHVFGRLRHLAHERPVRPRRKL